MLQTASPASLPILLVDCGRGYGETASVRASTSVTMPCSSAAAAVRIYLGAFAERGGSPDSGPNRTVGTVLDPVVQARN
ncbi:hypothetical protein ACWEJS_27160, partial [Rhodococcus triatomae]